MSAIVVASPGGDAPAPIGGAGRIVASAAQHYRLLALLGKGSHGDVYEAMRLGAGASARAGAHAGASPGADDIVAVKLANAGADTTSRASLCLRQEAALCATLFHPRIPALLDRGDAADGRPFAVFARVPGTTLRDHLLLHGPLPGTAAVALMDQLLEILAYLHGRNVVHGDVKPQNIMLAPSGQVHLIDFGNATPAARGICSAAYSPLEQLRGDPPVPAFDLHAWALVLLECLSGRPPSSGCTMRELFHRRHDARAVPMPGVEAHPLGALLRQVLGLEGQHSADARLLRQRLRRIDARGIRRRRVPGTGPRMEDTARTEPVAWPLSHVMR